MTLKHRICVGLLASFIILLSGHTSFSQGANEIFGKNRIQYKDFSWRFFHTDNFDIYFYDGGEWLAHTAAEFLEEEFEKITDLLGYAPYFKTKIFLYNSVTDLHQSNVGMKGKQYSEGGQTDFVKTQVEIAYPGTAKDFKDELIYKISKMLVYDMMYGGSIADMFQNSYLLNLPDWFMDGASMYLAKGWDVRMDDYMRDLMQKSRIKNLNRYTGDEAKLIGQSIWNYIAEKYGKSNISNILNLTRITRNQERSISNTLGVPLRQFMAEWQAYYSAMGTRISGSHQFPTREDKFIRNNRKEVIYSDMALSPDGNRLAYVVINNGKFKVYVSELDRKKPRTRRAVSGGYKIMDQDIHEHQPVLAWQDNNNLGIIGPLYGRTHLWIYNAAANRRTKKELGRLNNVRSFDIDAGGSLAVLSADVDGKNDLFLISLRRNSIKRITNDIFDEINPRFIPNTSSIVFSSNRNTDTLLVKEDIKLNQMKTSFNLFIYSIDTTKDVFTRLTNTLGNDIKPIPTHEQEIFYLSDQKGIYNIYKYNLNNNIYNQVSSYAISLKDFDLDKDKTKLSFISIADEREQLYVVDGFNFSNNIFTPATTRVEIDNARMAAQRLLTRKSLEPQEPEEEKEDQEVVLIKKQKSEIELLLESSDDLINTDNYTFGDEVLEEVRPKESFLEAFRRTQRETRIGGPLDYETRFSADNVVTTFVIDPLIGFGMQIKTHLTDLLEDHNFYGGITATADFSSGRLFAEYQYLKKRIDYAIRYDRDIIKASGSSVNQKYVLNKFKFSSSLPFTVSSRLSLSPFVANTSYYDLSYSIIYPNQPQPQPSKQVVHYGGLQASYVFDNTIATGLNAFDGLRAKLTFTHYEGFESNANSFSNIKVDIRNYQKIYRELVFATRFFYGRFLGNNKQTYMLGGMDNWIFNKTNNTPHGERNPLQMQEFVNNSNILFLEYVTSLRGFNYNTFNGTNSMLFNAELRLPLLRVLYKGPIASNFFRNLQFIGFYDIGSAWTGNSPFATENNINTETIIGGPFEIRLKNYKNPWLSSYGFGARTVILGYYAKFDLAYPIIDYVVQKPRFHLTLGYDF
jgi:Tol biopolymer transport system component